MENHFILSIKIFEKYKFRNVIISSCYMSEKIKKYVNNYIDFINIKIVDDGKPLGTGGAVVKSLRHMKKFFYYLW